MDTTVVTLRPLVARSVARAPVIGVIRTSSTEDAARQARLFMDAGIELVEITYTVPGAPQLVCELLAGRSATKPEGGPPWIGMGTVTTSARATEAVEAGCEFVVSPNASPEVAKVARQADLFLVLGALTPTEVCTAAALGADLVKVYPLPTVGGPAYLATIRQPLGDIPMLAGGGFGVEEIPAYRAAGAAAFGMGPTLLGNDDGETRRRIARALALARGE
jgi:2-dehydro-3-deoxyphosphogluconate aldolase / (4S)-4-hydroxy-2-oxoglutarate aldolase